MFCPYCGKELNAQDAFCPYCGAKNAAAAPAQEPAPVQDYGNQTPMNPVPDYGSQKPMNPVADYGSQKPMDPVPDYGNQTPMNPVPDYGTQAPAETAPAYGAQIPEAPLPDYGAAPADQYYTYVNRPAVDPAADPAGVYGPASYLPGKTGRGRAGKERKPRLLKQDGAGGGKKKLVVALVCVLLAALLGLGVFGLVTLLSPERQLRSAAKKSAKQLGAYLSELPNLKKVVDNVTALSKKQAFTAKFTGERTLEGEKNGFGGVLSYNRKTKQMRLDLDPDLISAALNNSDIEDFSAYEGKTASLYLTDKEIQGTSRIMTGKEVYSLPLKDLGEKWNDSDLADVLDTELPEGLSINPFDLDGSADAYLASIFGKEWTAFRKSVKIRRVKAADSIFEDAKKGTTYAMTWDEDALEDLADKAQDLIDDHKTEYKSEYGGEYYDWEYDAEFNRLTHGICKYIIEVEETMDDCDEYKVQYFVQKGCLIGVGAYVEMDEGEETVIALLTGDDNPWEEIELTIDGRFKDTYNYSDETRTEWRKVHRSVTITLDMGKNDLEITGVAKSKDSDGSTDTDELFTILYDDRSGEISGEIDGGKFGDDPVITLKPDGKNVVLSVKGIYHTSRREEVWNDYWEEWDYNWVDVQGEAEIELSIGPLSGKIEALSKKPVDLLSLDKDELKDLADEIEDRIEEYDRE